MQLCRCNVHLKKQTNVYVCVCLSICFRWNKVALFGHVSVHVSACSRTHVWMGKQHIKRQVISPQAVILAPQQAPASVFYCWDSDFGSMIPTEELEICSKPRPFPSPVKLIVVLLTTRVSCELWAKEKAWLNFQSTWRINPNVPNIAPFIQVWPILPSHFIFLHHKPLFSRWAHGQNNKSYVTGAVKEGTSHPRYQGSCLLWSHSPIIGLRTGPWVTLQRRQEGDDSPDVLNREGNVGGDRGFTMEKEKKKLDQEEWM